MLVAAAPNDPQDPNQPAPDPNAQAPAPVPTATSTPGAGSTAGVPAATGTATSTPAAPPGSPTDTPTRTLSPTITATFTITGTPTPSPTKTPVIARSGMALLPTGYSNRLDRVDGMNLDLLFTYYIGAIAERRSDSDEVEYLNPLRLWLFTADVKHCWFDENGDLPGLSTGFMNTLLLLGTSPGASAAGGGSFKFTASSMGSVYTALSKTVARDTSVHLGYMRGNLRDVMGKLGKTVRKISPNRNHSELLTLLTDDLSDVRDESAPNIVYTGFDTKFLGTFWRFEVWKPFPLSREPILFNTKIDRLFSFNLAYEKWQGGYALLGYFNFRFTIIPAEPKRKAVRP
jgi:hypothetical protein